MNALTTRETLSKDSFSSLGGQGNRLFQIVHDPKTFGARRDIGQIPALLLAGAPSADFYDYLNSSCDQEGLKKVQKKFIKEHNTNLCLIRFQQVLMVVWFGISLASTFGLLISPFGLPLFTIGIIGVVVVNGLISTIYDENSYQENGKFQSIKFLKSFYKHTFSPGALGQKKNYKMEQFLATKEGLHLFPGSKIAKQYLLDDAIFYDQKAKVLVQKLKNNESIYADNIRKTKKEIRLYEKGKRYRFGPLLQEILLKSWTFLYIASVAYPPFSFLFLMIRWVIYAYAALSILSCLHDMAREKMSFKEILFRCIDICFCPSTFKEWLKEKKEDLRDDLKCLEANEQLIQDPFSQEAREEILHLLEEAIGPSSIDRKSHS